VELQVFKTRICVHRGMDLRVADESHGGGQLSFYSWPSKQAKQVWKACREGTYTHTHARTPMLSFVKHCNSGVLHKLPSWTRTVDWDQSREGGGFHY
jgi:hypothetical protein